ncbi:MAG: putative helix-destabilizing protein [Prokaryotic dsDNA virus sp.]|nr:MAG: putative helix-destabilizing protein [Prokaryotic dsDNA virus sp.]
MAQAPKEYFTTPVGRIISGDPWTKQTTDANNRPIPEEKQNYWFALAVEKNAPGMNELLGTLHKAASAGYAHAQNVMAQVNQGLAATAFSWKVADGDEQRQNPTTGAMENRWAHGAGCWVLKFSTTLPIRPAKYQGNVPTDCATSEIKRGYYVQVAGSTSANGNTDHTAGIYLNPQTVCLVGYGEEIVGGPSLDQQFTGGPGGYMPAGMTQAPQPPTGAPGAMGQPPQQPPMGNPQATPAPQQPPAYGSGMPSPSAPNTATGYPGDPMGNAPQQPTPAGGPSMPQGAGAGMPQPGGNAPDGQQPPMYGGYMTPPNGQ